MKLVKYSVYTKIMQNKPPYFCIIFNNGINTKVTFYLLLNKVNFYSLVL
ncbi:hypothetical protein PTRA_b0235 [Pseudoalteromonas translucida KMM 520]|uniref:Uncharacterized protein n=1 Tax=Pseudoalteromonas translucida KMM 520 TaxID=1315283 RepID=A0A0U2ITC9_9GAMM|nr:hypothetical protein PTRA_b0235 [Pseudoalteromonas translucida KMM 520]